jgi:hypothetical protein
LPEQATEKLGSGCRVGDRTEIAQLQIAANPDFIEDIVRELTEGEQSWPSPTHNAVRFGGNLARSQRGSA